MTLIEFYFNVADKYATLTELALHYVERGKRICILFPSPMALEDFSNYLVQQSCLLLVHSNCSSINTPASQDLPLYMDYAIKQMTHDDVLISLNQNVPTEFSRFLLAIELVGLDEPDKQAARERYKFYRARGYQIKNIDTTKH